MEGRLERGGERESGEMNGIMEIWLLVAILACVGSGRIGSGRVASIWYGEVRW